MDTLLSRVSGSFRRVILTALTLGALSTAGSVHAQTVPPIDLFVYLDNSKTIFTGGPDAPNRKLVEMLHATFSHKIGGDAETGGREFVSAGDRVYFYTFGKGVTPVAQAVDGGNQLGVASALDRLSKPVKADSVTDFAPLFKAIAANQVISAFDGRLKVVLIASDFIHDPTNTAKNKKKTGICDLLEAFGSGTPPLSREIDGLAKLTKPSTAGLPVFFGLLAVTPNPRDLPSQGSAYSSCALETARQQPLPELMRERLQASLIDYGLVVNDVGAFANTFITQVLQAGLPPVILNAGSCRPRGVAAADCALTVRNNGLIPTRLDGVSFYDGQIVKQPLVTLPLSPALGIPANSEASKTVNITGATAQSILATPDLFVGFPGGAGRGGEQRFRMEMTQIKPLDILAATAGHDRADQAYTVFLDVDNPQTVEKQAARLLFFGDKGDGPALDQRPIARPEPLRGNERATLSSELSRTLEDRLKAGELWVAIESREDSGANVKISPRKKILLESEAPPEIVSARATVQSEQALQVNLELRVSSATLRPNTLIRVNLLGADGRTELTRIDVTDPQQVGPGGALYQLTLPPSAATQALQDVLQITVVDTHSGRASAPRRVERVGLSRTLLKPTSCQWDTRPQQNMPNGIRLLCTIENTGGFRATVSGVGVSYLAPNGRARVGADQMLTLTLPSSGGVRVESRGQTTIPVPVVPVRGASGQTAGSEGIAVDLNRYPWLLNEQMAVAVIDSDGNLSADTTPLSKMPRKPLIIVGEPQFKATDGGDLGLTFVVRNDGPVTGAIKSLRVLSPGKESTDAGTLPLDGPRHDVQPNTSETITIPFSDRLRQDINPHQPHQLVLQEEDANTPDRLSSSPPYTITPLAPEPLKISKTGPWRKGQPITLTVTLTNGAAYPQTLDAILLARSRQETPERHSFQSDQPVAQPAGKDALVVQVPFPPERAQRLLGGDTLLLCPVTQEIPPAAAGDCPGDGWLPVRLGPEREPLVPVAGDQPDFIPAVPPNPATLRVRVSNPGAIPNQLTGLTFYSADGPNVLLTKPAAEAPLVVFGATEARDVSLDPSDLAVLLKEKGPPRIASLDQTSDQPQAVRRPEPRPWRIPLLHVTRDTGEEFTIQKVPDSTRYLSIWGKFSYAPTPGLPINEIPFDIILTKANQPEGSIPATVGSRNRAGTFTVGWRFPYDFETGGDAKISFRQGGTEIASFPIPDKATVHIKTFAIIAVAMGFTGFLIAVFFGKKYFGSWIPNVMPAFSKSVTKVERVRLDISIVLNWVGLSSAGVVLPITGSLTQIIPWTAGYVIMLWGAIVCAAGGFFSILWWKTLRINGIADRGTDPMELPSYSYKWHRLCRTFGVIGLMVGCFFLWLGYDWYMPKNIKNATFHYDFEEMARPVTVPAGGVTVSNVPDQMGGSVR